MKPWEAFIEIAAPDALVRDAANDDLAWLEAKGCRSIAEFRHVYRLLTDPFGGQRVAAVRREEVAAWFRWRASKLRPDGQPVVAANTHHKIRSMWHAFFERAGAHPNPAALPPGTLPPRAPRPDYRPAEMVLAPHEASRLISSARLPLRRRVQWALPIFTGARSSEVSAFRWRHLVARRPLWGLRVCESYSTKRNEIGPTKGNVDAIVPIAEPLEELLDEWRMYGFEEAFGRAPAPDDFIVPRSWRGELRPQYQPQILKALKRDLAVLGLPDRDFHSLRHTFSTLTVNAGANEDVIFSFTHAPDTSAIRDIYRHWLWPRVCAEIEHHPVKLYRAPVQLDLGLVAPVSLHSPQAGAAAHPQHPGGPRTPPGTPPRGDHENAA